MTFSFSVSSPQTSVEYADYYELRWRILRAPWQQAKGSEKDDLEDAAIHRVAIHNNTIVGVGRIHITQFETAQIRYMAVDEKFNGRGIGTAILESLEQAIMAQGIKTITLQARENAVNFYLKNGYQEVKETHLLFGKIQHFEMVKHIK